MNIWPWSKLKNATLKEPEWWKQTLGFFQTGSGVSVTPDSAMQVATIYACVRLIAETAASLPLRIYRHVDQGAEPLHDHPLTRILGMAPNGESTAMDLREFLMTNVLLRGNGYCQQIRNARGQVVELQPLNSRYMNVDRDRDGSLIFDYQEPGGGRVFGAQQLWRVHGLSFDGVTGKSPITLARECIGTAVAMEQHGGRLFKNGLHTNLVLEFPQQLSDEQFDRLKKQIADAGGITNTGKPFIAESGLKVAEIGMNNDDAQFLDSRKFSVLEMARWYRVPPHMIGDLERATFSNIEHQSIAFVRDTIRPWLIRLEQTIYRDLLNEVERRQYFAKHSVEGLLRGDTKTRYEAYKMAVENGWMSRNEVRGLEDLNRVDGLDEYLVPLNMGSATDRENDLADTVANIASIAEVRALVSENSLRDESDFLEWLPDFYSRFKDRLTGEFGVSDAKARDYVVAHIELFDEHPVPSAIKHIERQSKREIAAML